MGDDELRVEITPRDYKARAVSSFVAAAVFLALGGLAEFFRWRSVHVWSLVPVAIVFGIYCAIQARRQVTSTEVVLSADGWRSVQVDGFQHDWHGVIMIWVGSAPALPGRRGGRVLQIYTRAGIDFARRLGAEPRPRDSLGFETDHTVAELCERLRRWTAAEVVDGTVVSRREAVRRLAERHSTR